LQAVAAWVSAVWERRQNVVLVKDYNAVLRMILSGVKALPEKMPVEQRVNIAYSIWYDLLTAKVAVLTEGPTAPRVPDAESAEPPVPDIDLQPAKDAA
jgi:hypothetical protein